MKNHITRAITLLVMAASALLVVPVAHADRDDWRRERNRSHRYNRDWDSRYRTRVYEDRYWTPSYRYQVREARPYRYDRPNYRDYYRDRWYDRDTWRFDDSWYDTPVRIRVNIN